MVLACSPFYQALFFLIIPACTDPYGVFGLRPYCLRNRYGQRNPSGNRAVNLMKFLHIPRESFTSFHSSLISPPRFSNLKVAANRLIIQYVLRVTHSPTDGTLDRCIIGLYLACYQVEFTVCWKYCAGVPAAACQRIRLGPFNTI